MEKFNIGNIIQLSDEDSYKVSMKAGQGLKPLLAQVTNITTIKSDFCKWLIIDLQCNLSKGLVLMIKVVDNNVDYYKFNLTDLPVDNRKGHIDNGNFFLFQQPEHEDFILNDLLFSETITEEFDSEQDKIQFGDTINYFIKKQGQLTGEANTIPKRSGLNDLIGTVVEYTSTTIGVEGLLIELGSVDSTEGGLITFYRGMKISETDIK